MTVLRTEAIRRNSSVGSHNPMQDTVITISASFWGAWAGYQIKKLIKNSFQWLNQWLYDEIHMALNGTILIHKNIW